MKNAQNPKEIAASKGCFVCGSEHSHGLRLKAYEVNNEAQATYTASSDFQGYGGILHGGIISTLLDEIMAKAVITRGKQAVTANLQIKFRQPVHIGQTITLRGWIESSKGRIYKTRAIAEVPDKKDGKPITAAEAEAVFVRTDREDS